MQMTEAGTAPLIYVLMVLIVMLIVTQVTQAVPSAIHSGSLPNQAASAEARLVLVRINAKGSVMWGDDTLGSAAELSTRIANAANQTVQPEIALQPTPDTPYAFVAQVLLLTQTAGLQKVGVLH